MFVGLPVEFVCVCETASVDSVCVCWGLEQVCVRETESEIER